MAQYSVLYEHQFRVVYFCPGSVALLLKELGLIFDLLTWISSSIILKIISKALSDVDLL